MKLKLTAFFILLLSFIYLDVSGQDGVTYDLKKPEKYENFQLASEKTPDKKFKIPRHFIQNTITHYNFYFNANNKLNEVIARAKSQNRDDYARLLPFYNYSLDITSRDKKELDSVISKCTAGILVHDLRNDWVDNLLLLMGRAYYFKKNFDTAYIIFQFVNYAFSPKEKDGYDIPIASNANHEEGGSNFIISTNEQRPVIKKMLSLPPSRNESLVWQVKNFLALDELTRAATLIDALKHDPQFPQRLQYDLQEVQALWYYKQDRYDSAAYFLVRALPEAPDRTEQARWEYLIGQLYERARKPDQAKAYYEAAVAHTYDPVLEVYARLNAIQQNKGTGEDYIEKNLEALERMGRRELYAPYRDLIYYTAAAIVLGQGDTARANGYLLHSAKYSTLTSPQRNRTYMLLGDLAFTRKDYPSAKRFYDSLSSFNLTAIDTLNLLAGRKRALSTIVSQLMIIERQDSLQWIAGLSADDRDAYIKKLLKAMNRRGGSNDDEESTGNNFTFSGNGSGPTDLFGSSSGNADWYFYNPSLKSKGYTDFKTKWGNRPNVDNWFLSALAAKQRVVSRNGPIQGEAADSAVKQAASPTNSYASLLANIPLDSLHMSKSRDSVEKAYLAMGIAFQDELPDYLSAIAAYDSILVKFPQTRLREEVIFHLFYCYRKLGDNARADDALSSLRSQYPSGKYTARLLDASEKSPGEGPRVAATREYDAVYNSFIEGDFARAETEKRIADSLYGEKYWTPQLLYIEAVYYAHNREDNLAINGLNKVVMRYAGTPMAFKARTLIDVLGRRRQIEDYLTHLQITREPDDSVIAASDIKIAPNSMATGGLSPDTSAAGRPRIGPAPNVPKQKQDSFLLAHQNALLKMRQLNRLKADSAQLSVLRKEADSVQALQRKVHNNMTKSLQLKKLADSLQAALLQVGTDSLQLAMAMTAPKSSYVFRPDQPHSVAIWLSKVDPVYATETGNAFNRYNRETYYNKTLDISTVAINDSIKLVLISGFDSAAEALNYLDKAKVLAPREIIPWLPAGKYAFLIFIPENLELLKSNKDMNAYRNFLRANYPGRFQ